MYFDGRLYLLSANHTVIPLGNCSSDSCCNGRGSLKRLLVFVVCLREFCEGSNLLFKRSVEERLQERYIERLTGARLSADLAQGGVPKVLAVEKSRLD